jgi:hypothetical protein
MELFEAAGEKTTINMKGKAGIGSNGSCSH